MHVPFREPLSAAFEELPGILIELVYVEESNRTPAIDYVMPIDL